ncbi:hypothetical protein [Paenibacillus elgii]|uniref:hypothetical protein n=1 Tax=Paenibacillus elgii TaxID=189691 RepID=UPI000248D21C|nr:hypothetical protein [Paenibacillus elgii]
MQQIQSITLHKDDINESAQITFRQLYNELLAEMETYRKLGLLEELMDQKIKIDIVDLNGNVLGGYATLFVGWLENGEVLLTGNLREVFIQ